MSGSTRTEQGQKILEVSDLGFSYGERKALDGVSLALVPGTCFGLLGPNGGGKSTFFSILSTLLPVQTGSIILCGHNLGREPAAARAMIGVVFQQPSVDIKLTARENLIHQGHLYGLRGKPLADRVETRLREVGLEDRADEPVEGFSGGMRRRLEIIKALLHKPSLLILDEPSTGLDPGARADLRGLLDRLRREEGVTVLLTTHLMEEAMQCDEVALIDQGRIVARGRPDELCQQEGGEVLVLQGANPTELAVEVRERTGLECRQVGGEVRVEGENLGDLVPRLSVWLGDRLDSIRLGRPTLEDVFLNRTGHRLQNGEEMPETDRKKRRKKS